jgi:hypothetical protein
LCPGLAGGALKRLKKAGIIREISAKPAALNRKCLSRTEFEFTIAPDREFDS